MTYGRTQRSRQPCGPPTRCRRVVAPAGQPSRGSRTGPSPTWGLRAARWYSFIIRGVASVICLALTLDSWVNDVASLLATVLGYGLTLTRDLAMETYGLRAGHTTSHHRQIAYETIRDRLPESRVLSHYARLGTPPRSPFISPSHQWDKDVIYVWLREGDDVLQEWVDRGYPEVTLEHLITHRLALDDFATRVPNPAQVITLDISRQAEPTAKWQQVLECVSSALTQMVDRGFLTTDLAFVHAKAQQDDPSIAVPLLRWLRKDGCAAVID